MDFALLFGNASSFSVIPAALISMRKVKKTDPSFLPFHLFIWAGLITEVISAVTIALWRTNAVSSNIYILAEALLLTWQFSKWELFDKKKLPFVFSFFILAWGAEYLVFDKITEFNPYFRVAYCFTIAILSMAMFNKLLIEETRSVSENLVFILCIAFLVCFTFKVLVEVFYAWGHSWKPELGNYIYMIFSILNFFINLLYMYVLLRMPKRQSFLLA